MNPYRILEWPWVYDFVQFLFGSKTFFARVMAVLEPYKSLRILELGSGTGAFTATEFPQIFASDINSKYLEKITLPSERKFLMSAVDLSSGSQESWDLIYSVGLYHHLSDDQMLTSLDNCFAKLNSNGKVIFIDNIYPTNWNPVAYLVRYLDRGGHVRFKSRLEKLFQSRYKVLSSETGRYAWCGLEYIVYHLQPKSEVSL